MTEHVADSPSSSDDEFRAFFRDKYDELVRFLARRTGDWCAAEQVAQEVMWQLSTQFGVARSPAALMYRIARCQVSNWRRGQRRAPVDLYTDMAELEAVLAEREFGAVEGPYEGLSAALRALPSRQQEAIELRFMDDLEFSEIAALMGISVGSAQTTVSRALARLRQSAGLAVYPPAFPEVRK